MVRVIKNDGQVIEKEVFHAHGDFDDPAGYSEQQLIEKFRSVTQKHLGREEQDQLIDKILRGNEEDKAQDIFRTYYDSVR